MQFICNNQTDFFFHFFHLDNHCTRKQNSVEGLQFLHLICQDLELQVALTGRKKPVLGQNFFYADHHFEPHKIGF